MHFLVVAHEAKVNHIISEILSSYQYTATSATNIAAARDALESNTFDAAIIDVPLPMKSGARIRREYGRNFVREIRRHQSHKMIPIICIAESKHCDFDFVISLMKRGRKHESYIDCVVDSLTNDRLGNAIELLMSYQDKKVATGTEPFTARKRVLTIEEESVKLCGLTVWQETISSDLKHILIALSQQNEHGYIRIPGPKLNELLNRSISNPAGPIINRFKKDCARLLNKNGFGCEPNDIIGPSQGGGYHYPKHIIVDLQCDHPLACCTTDTQTRKPRGLSELACHIFDEIKEDSTLRQSILIQRYAPIKSASSVKRALAELRDRRLIITDKKMHYTVLQQNE